MNFFQNLKTFGLKIWEFFQDGSGASSATRLSQHMIVCTTLGLWVKACAVSGWHMVAIDPTHVLLVGTALGAKAIQSFAENK